MATIMSRVNATISHSYIRGANFLGGLAKELDGAAERLESGYRINKAADDPAGLIHSIELRRQMSTVEAAVKQNHDSYFRFGELDNTHQTMLKHLINIRENIRDSQGEFDPFVQNAIVDEVSALIDTVDRHAQTARLGNKAVLAGAGRITFDSTATNLLDVNASHMRRVSQDGKLSMFFDQTEFAQQAYVRDAYVAPAVDSQYEITINGQSTTLLIAAGTAGAAAASQINSALTGIDGFANWVAADGEIVIGTLEYGDAQQFQINKIAGDDIIGAGLIGVQQTGVDGRVTVNSRQYALNGDLSVNVSDTLSSGVLAFDPAQVARDATAVGGVVDPANNQNLLVELSGGIQVQFGSEPTPFEGAVYGLRDLTRGALSLDRIVNNLDPAYLLTNADAALNVIDRAIDTVQRSAVDIGNIMANDLEQQNDHLLGLMEELSANFDALMDVDEAAEAARMAKIQIIQQAGISAMAMQTASQQAVLGLLDAN